MKRTAYFALILALLFALASCGSGAEAEYASSLAAASAEVDGALYLPERTEEELLLVRYKDGEFEAVTQLAEAGETAYALANSLFAHDGRLYYLNNNPYVTAIDPVTLQREVLHEAFTMDFVIAGDYLMYTKGTLHGCLTVYDLEKGEYLLEDGPEAQPGLCSDGQSLYWRDTDGGLHRYTIASGEDSVLVESGAGYPLLTAEGIFLTVDGVLTCLDPEDGARREYATENVHQALFYRAGELYCFCPDEGTVRLELGTGETELVSAEYLYFAEYEGTLLVRENRGAWRELG